MKNLSYLTIIAILMMAIPVGLFAQTEETPAPLGPEIVKATFENNIHINNQTVNTTEKGYMEFLIQHRFGLIEKSSDLWGIYAPSNIRLYVGYGITSKLSAGFGLTKNKQLYDFNYKYAILQQKTQGMPVSVTYSGNIGIKGGEDKTVQNGNNEYKFSNRLSYYSELLIARKFNKSISLQAGVNYVHYNMIDSAVYGDKFDFVGVSFLGRYKFSPQGSFMFEFDQPLSVSNMPVKSLPNLGLGVEFSTGYHQFQIFVCNSTGILNQEAKFNNYNDMSKKQFVFGFNITRQFGFGE